MHPAVIPIGSIILGIIFYTWLAWRNFKMLQANKEERIAARREYKRLKNERLRKMFNLRK